ncbi:MAG: hypothetical protein U0Q12_19115 [Vicinamibacterales bacterium]
MDTRAAHDDLEALFLQHLSLIDRTAAFVARRRHMRVDRIRDFQSDVRLKIIEDDYAVLRKFQGRSRISTYLTTVIARFY